MGWLSKAFNTVKDVVAVSPKPHVPQIPWRVLDVVKEVAQPVFEDIKETIPNPKDPITPSIINEVIDINSRVDDFLSDIGETVENEIADALEEGPFLYGTGRVLDTFIPAVNDSIVWVDGLFDDLVSDKESKDYYLEYEFDPPIRPNRVTIFGFKEDDFELSARIEDSKWVKFIYVRKSKDASNEITLHFDNDEEYDSFRIKRPSNRGGIQLGREEGDAEENQNFEISDIQAILDKHKGDYHEPGTTYQDLNVKPGYTTWEQQPWHPIKLAWDASLFPMATGSNHESPSSAYDPQFFTQNYTLHEHDPEFSVKPDKEVQQSPLRYTGSTILTPYAKEYLRHKAIEELNSITVNAAFEGEMEGVEEADYRSELGAWLAGKPSLSTGRVDTEKRKSEIKDYQEWYEDKPVYLLEGGSWNDYLFQELPETEQNKDYYYAVIQSYLYVEFMQCVSQSLSGFNAGMLMHHHRLQIPIADPLAFEEHQSFTEAVAEALRDHTRWGCWPENDFNPLRSGVLRLNQLQVIDSFGRVKDDIDLEGLIKSEPVNLPEKALQHTESNDIWMAPRLVQPTRIDFRWLDADHGTTEMNSHPSSSPIIGWVLCNHLDDSLAIYDRSGRGLGLVDHTAAWRSLPGDDRPVSFNNIHDHLRRVIQKLCFEEALPEEVTEEVKARRLEKQAFVKQFTSMVDEAIEWIEPETSVHDDGLMQLLGHPLAITRASLEIVLNKPAVIDHGWMAFHQYLDGGDRQTNDFEKVKIPVRVGEADRLNDGVVGYWLEDGDALDNTFHSVVAGEPARNISDGTLSVNSDVEERIQTYDPENPGILISPADEKTYLTLLMDPRGNAHAVTGVLPVKTINIPDQEFAKTMKAISAGQFSTRILSPKAQVIVPFLHESGHTWSWWQKDRSLWHEVAERGVIHKGVIMSEFEKGEELWELLLAKSWLKRTTQHKAEIVPSDERKSGPVPVDHELWTEVYFEEKAGTVHRWLEQSQLQNATADAKFHEQIQVKEGWLSLQIENDDA